MRSSSDWRDYALCREVDLELFFPAQGESPNPAKFVCGRCEVSDECLADAYATGAGGVRGGLTEHQRARRRTAMRKGQAA